MASGKRHSALEWLEARPLGYRADRFAEPGGALAFVRSLYDAGATKVDVIVEDGRDSANLSREGIWLEEEGPPRDSGRQEVTLWWD